MCSTVVNPDKTLNASKTGETVKSTAIGPYREELTEQNSLRNSANWGQNYENIKTNKLTTGTEI